MLSEVAILLSTHRTRRPKLVMHIGDVPLQVSLEIAAVATVGAFKVLHLHMLLVNVVSKVGELS